VIYVYECPVCGKRIEQSKPVAERDIRPTCCVVTRRVMLMPRVNMNGWAYDDLPTGTSMVDKVREAHEADKRYERRNANVKEYTPPPEFDMVGEYRRLQNEAVR
jgi:DNA-directed RNA polymerase subunit RPC12/RpoP